MGRPLPLPRREVAELLASTAKTGLYLCFGCQKSGDAITFVREIEHLDFVGAVEWLAARAGITLRYTDHDEGETRKKRQRLHDAMEKAVDWYHDRLLTGVRCRRGAGLPAQPGLRRRRPCGRYRLGWAPSGVGRAGARPRSCPRTCSSRPASASRTARGRPTDAFRGRLLFPIFDPEGRGGRVRRPDPAGRRRSEVQELTGDRALQQVAGALRPQLAQERDRQRTAPRAR